MMHDDQAPAEAASWHIKNVPVYIRSMAVDGARAARMSVADWISEAVKRMADNQIIPPGNPGNPPSAAPARPLPMLDLAAAAAAMVAVAHLTETAGTGKTPAHRLQFRLAREAERTIRAYLREARGLPARQPKQPGVTIATTAGKFIEGN